MKRTFQENHEEVNDSDNEDDNDEEEEEQDEDFEAMTLEEGDDDDDDDDDDDGEEEEEDDDDEEDMEDERTSTINVDTRASDGNIDGNNEFLDSFYGISSSDIKERTIAGRIMIHHCLLSNTPATTSTTSNVESTTSSSLSPLQIKDATYALRRLMNGLCSGRAAARQGNAATLSSFIKVAISLQQIPDIRNEWLSKEKGNYKNRDTEQQQQQQQSDLAFIRYALISVTEPTVSSTGTSKRSQQGHKSSSEEREYKLGRLFGITAIIRSGVIRHLILSSSTSSEASVQNSDTIGKDIFNIVNDLIGLYRYKKWIREPVAHAICSLLYSLFVPGTSTTTNSTNTIIQEVVTHVVEQLIMPQLLIKGDDDTNETKQREQAGDDDNRLIRLLSTYSAEQIAIAVCIQTIYNIDPNHTLSYPLNHTILCTETIPIFATALCVTTNSIMTQSPRIHLVWDVIIEYISKSFTYNISNNSNNTKMDYRRLKELLPLHQALDSDKVDDTIRTIIQSVIIERLLGIAPSNKNIDDEQQLKPSGNVTNKVLQERYTLSYYLIRILLSVEYISSIQSTPIRLIVTCDHIESIILVPVIVQNLFVNVICNSGKSKPHIMKSYALQVLDQITNTMLNDTSIAKENIDNNETMYNDLIQKRLTVACALLQCDARFDAKTKTSTIDQLLGISTSHGNVDKNDHDDTDTVLKLTLHPYMTFLEQRIIGTNRTNYEIQGYIDLLYHLGKALIRNESTDSDATQRVFGFLLTIAFFDCTNIESVETSQLVQTKKKKKEKKRQSNTTTSQNHPIIEVGQLIQQSRLKSNVSPTFSYDIRSVASARFFSLLTDTITSTIHSTSIEKESRIIDILSKFHYLQTLLINAGAKKIVTITPSDDVDTDDKDVPPDVIITKLIDDARKAHQSDNKKTSIARWKNGCAILASTLYLHLLSCGHPDVGVDEIDPNADDEEDYEEIVDLMNDLQDITELYTNDDVTSDESPLAALAELCARILSSPLGVGSQSRGASPTLLREAVKLAWTGGLTLSASYSNDESSTLDKDTVNVLLNAIGAIDDTSQGVSGGDDDESDNDIDDDDSIDDEESEEEHTTVEKGLFSSITGVDELQDHEMKTDSIHNDEDDDDDGEELHVDAEKLKLLLEEESDADVDEGELEHHEGADAALAKLIQLKQEARKAGILARERTEIARQIRCIQLLETLVVGKEGTWGSLLRVDLMLHILLPILKYRSDILKSLSKAKSKGSNTGLSEKGSLLSKLTALLKNKILKAKVSDIEWTESTDVNDASDAFCSALMKLALESDDKEHQSLCNSCILFLLRCIPNTKLKLERASVYREAVTQWSTKRTTRLDVSFFEGLIHQSPVIAQASIVDAFAMAAMNGRSTYLKSESYRLLSLLYNPKLNTNTTDLEKIALSRLLESSTNVCESIASSLKDKEMKKTKRVRDVLRAADKVVQFLLVSSSIPPNCLNRLQDIINLLNELKGDSESQSIVNSVAKLLSNIQSLTSKENSNEMNIDDPVDPSEDIMETNEMSKQELTKSNKKANKSKKKRENEWFNYDKLQRIICTFVVIQILYRRRF